MAKILLSGENLAASIESEPVPAPISAIMSAPPTRASASVKILISRFVIGIFSARKKSSSLIPKFIFITCENYTQKTSARHYFFTLNAPLFICENLKIYAVSSLTMRKINSIIPIMIKNFRKI